MANRFRSALRRCGIVAAAAMGTVLGPKAEAVAQDMQQQRARDVERGVTVLTRARPDYDPLGVRLGGFRLDGQVEVGPGYDSNLFGTKSNRVSDGFVDETAALNLRSDWTTHALGVDANMAARQYFNNPLQDWQDWSVGGFGRYDFSIDTNVEARYRHSQQHLDVFNFDVQTAGIGQPVPYTSDEVQVNGFTRLNRVGLLASGYYRTFRFQDVVINGTPTQVSLNDFNTAIGALGASYALAPGRSITAVFRLQD